MANLWNPNAPAVLGLEWPLAFTLTENIQQATPWATRLRSTVAETITNLQLRQTMNGSDLRSLFTLVDIIPAGSETPGTVVTADYAPNLDGPIGSWTTDVGGTSNLYQRIDDPVQYPPVGSDYIKTITGPTAYECECATGSFPNGARVVRLRVAAVIGAQSSQRQFQFRLHHVASATNYSPPGSNLWGGGFGTPVDIDFGEINPVTLLPWTPADIQSFDTGGWRIRVEAVGSAGNFAAVNCMALRVQYIATENRVAVATWRRPTNGSSPSNITSDQLVTLPAGTANWSKPNSGDFTFLWRKGYDLLLNPTGAAQANDIAWRVARASLFGAEPAPPVPGMTGLKLPVSNLGLVTGAPTMFPGRAGVISLNTAGGASNDSQTYTVFTRTATNAQVVAQRYTPGTNASYLDVRVLVAPPDDEAGTITATVHRVSDGVQFGGSVAWTADEVRAMPVILTGQDYRQLQGHLSSSAALVAGTQYEVRFTITGTGTWVFPSPHAEFGATVTYGGTTDSARDPSGVLANDDLAAVLFVQPDPPTNVAAAATAIAAPGDGECCSVAAIDALHVTWTPTAIGGTFARYEIERQEDDDNGPWQLIATITTEAVDELADYETRRGGYVRYRVRVINNQGAFSVWVETDWVQAVARKCEVVFASNARPELTVAYDRDPTVGYQFASHNYDVVHPIYGADYFVAFSEAEDRGVIFQLGITANFGRPAEDPATGDRIGGIRVFDRLAAIAHANPAIPYVCVLDHEGNRFYAHVQLDQGQNREPAYRYSATVTVTQLTATPAVLELAAEQTKPPAPAEV